MSGAGKGCWGNREVSPRTILGACAEAYFQEEGGPRGKHGFTRASEPKAREAA
jgi:hypothetical protein